MRICGNFAPKVHRFHNMFVQAKEILPPGQPILELQLVRRAGQDFGEKHVEICGFPQWHGVNTHRIHVSCLYLHLDDFHGKCKGKFAIHASYGI